MFSMLMSVIGTEVRASFHIVIYLWIKQLFRSNLENIIPILFVVSDDCAYDIIDTVVRHKVRKNLH